MQQLGEPAPTCSHCCSHYGNAAAPHLMLAECTCVLSRVWAHSFTNVNPLALGRGQVGIAHPAADAILTPLTCQPLTCQPPIKTFPLPYHLPPTLPASPSLPCSSSSRPYTMCRHLPPSLPPSLLPFSHSPPLFSSPGSPYTMCR